MRTNCIRFLLLLVIIISIGTPRSDARAATFIVDSLLDQGEGSMRQAILDADSVPLITGGFRLVQVTPFDLFPRTYHSEGISFYKKRS
jgi:hypothetical protein